VDQAGAKQRMARQVDADNDLRSGSQLGCELHCLSRICSVSTPVNRQQEAHCYCASAVTAAGTTDALYACEDSLHIRQLGH
jgi:hypothetical protein